MKDLGLVACFLDVAVYEGFLAKTSMEECKGCDTPFCIVFHLEKTIKGPLGQEFENSTLYRSNVRRLQYLSH